MAYDVKQYALDNVFDVTEVVQPSRRIAEVFINDVATGASFKLRVGDGNPFFTVSRPFSMEPQGEDEANRGLHIKNLTPQAGVTIEIVVVYGDGRSDQLNTVT